MATFLEIKNLVAGNVIDLPAVVLANLGTYVNRALETLQNAHRFKVMEVLGGPFSTTSGVRALTAAPTRFKEPRGNPYFQTQLGQTQDILWAPGREEAQSAFGSGTLDTGTPRLLVDAEQTEAGVRNFDVYPLPNGLSDWGNGEYRIYIPYWRYVTPLSADGDTNWFTTTGPSTEWIEMMASSNAFFADWDETRGTFWQKRAEGKLAEVVREDKRARLAALGSPATLVPLYRGARSPRVRF